MSQQPDGEATLQHCDFCGAEVPSVRRVALDADYERLRTPHRELYACPACSEAKERSRRGLPAPRRGA
jgi:hypothetical protein